MMVWRRPVMLWLVVVLAGCAARARRPDGPYRAAEELADALSDDAVGCTKQHPPAGSGMIVVVAEFTAEGQPPKLHDGGSMLSSEAVIACVRERANAKLHSPASVPAPFVRIRVPVPLVTSNVTYAFIQALPAP